MENLAQQRIGLQPVGIGVRIGGGNGIGAIEAGDQLRHLRLVATSARILHPHAAACEYRIGKSLDQFVNQPVLGFARQLVDGDARSAAMR